MRFILLDQIVAVHPGQKIEAVKNLTVAEEYLADHFPLFPVMPGVLMLEAMTQAGAWLIRASENFAHSMVVLKEARNVKYADFVRPGQKLVVSAEMLSESAAEVTLKTQGTVDGRVSVSARLILTRYNQADQNPRLARSDALLRQRLREQYGLLYRADDAPGPADSESSPAPAQTSSPAAAR
ncbi:MAG TPA: 3-hydroxyacyl-ACP dehydratase FabZ family protein [Pirellulales bacterium]|jgi:3-hydroxyacyl-[acyl-carrier-protein] dehydratase|nr:3-hydroxyacyl-ACP dehydratase FabZ family protein [Pirellulales bacterium]